MKKFAVCLLATLVLSFFLAIDSPEAGRWNSHTLYDSLVAATANDTTRICANWSYAYEGKVIIYLQHFAIANTGTSPVIRAYTIVDGKYFSLSLIVDGANPAIVYSIPNDSGNKTIRVVSPMNAYGAGPDPAIIIGDSLCVIYLKLDASAGYLKASYLEQKSD